MSKKEEVEISKSKQKREARKAEVKSEKTKKTVGSIVSWLIGIVIAAVVIGVIGAGIYKSLDKVTASSDFSEYLDEDGYIKGADMDAVTDLNVETMTIALADVEYTDDDVQGDIDDAIDDLKYYDDDATLTVADGDTINLDYVGSVDGEEFDGGSTDGSGTTLTIGSGSYIDDFEDQLIGAHPGDNVTVEVTFPDDYSTTDLAGKDAVFECTVNSIQVTPELTDELVTENFSDLGVATVDELKEYYRSQGYEENLLNYITQYISDNASVSKYPHAYTKHERSTIAYTDEQEYEYYNSVMEMYYGYAPYSSLYDFIQTDEDTYNSEIKDRAKTQTAIDMTYEYIFRKNSLTINEDEYNESLESYGEDSVELYGEPYFKQLAIKQAVIDFLEANVTVQ